ncbi:MAG: outer membrane beta-barrel protein [Legionella sp.]|nr:outer membrane beta-barrel protein [Legionella sp.]
MLGKTTITTIFSMLVNPCFSGFYVGGAIGPEGAMFTQKAYVVQTGPNNLNIIDKNHFAGYGGFGSLFAGYGWAINRLYLAGEINANVSSVQYEYINFEFVNSNFARTTFTIKHSQGLSLLPGLLLGPDTLFYGRLGYANGRVKINESDTSISSSNSNRPGFRYGLGMRHRVSSCWAVMMDYSQIHYKGINSSVFDPVGSVLKNTKITPYTAQVAFGLIYNFDSPIPQEITKD